MLHTRSSRVLAALPLFDACARFKSFTKAAHHLDLTQSAVSRRMQALEAEVGSTLFSRGGRRLTLTRDGERFWDYATETMRRLEATTQDFAESLPGILRIGTLPSIGAMWLTPRLGRFLDAHAHAAIELVTIDADFGTDRKDPLNWDPGAIDIAITWGRGGWAPLFSQRLMPETMLAVASLEFTKHHGLEAPGDLARVRRLSHTTRAQAWSRWGARHGIQLDSDTVNALAFEHFFMVLEAARSGLGVALLPEILVRNDIASGRLVAVPGADWLTGASYWCVSRPAAASAPVLSAFIRFLQTIANDRKPSPAANEL
ncbi:LysR substrate-binding domain-containing protein [Amorphus orientalis]|uniref:LysR family glycine cleavage system transcriptional activator n=1 Tax=Amorphus orientalis TaxID=649198 RepID=A0AAE3VRL5_9HYPH|nr:LysR substrate-binding domain-containing protein [Amorphus orientalis]MDQ0316853.1 LysR family glycine cleavage system transcriptional activator [Amorphus orientalis]